MNSFEFLKLKLEGLHLRFPENSFRYEYRVNRGSHVIEVTPQSFYNDNDYRSAETELEDEFESMFPGEDIIFVSEDSLTKISNPTLEFIGREMLCFTLDTNMMFNTLELDILQYAGENNYALAA